MSSSSGKKIIRKVFYATGEAVAEAEKLKNGLLEIAKSFQEGYRLLSNDPSGNGAGQGIKNCDQQLDSLYGYFGKIIHENIGNNNLSFHFKPGFEHLQRRAEELLNDILPKEAPSKEELPKEKTPGGNEVRKILSEDPVVRLKDVVRLSQLNTPQSSLDILSYSKDPDSLVRRVIVNSVDPERGDQEAFAIVKFINDPDEDVARIAIRKSAKIRNRLALTYLISRLESGNVKIRKEAIDALAAITGSDLGFNPTANESGHNEAVARWQQVWRDNQMNPKFLIDEEATRAILKKKYSSKGQS